MKGIYSIQDLDFQHHMSKTPCIMFSQLRGEVFIRFVMLILPGYWWNCWPSLF